MIVPLARILHVSTDALLGMTNPEQDVQKAEYDELCRKAHYPEQTETARKAVAEYPGEPEYILWLSGCLYMRAHEYFYADKNRFRENLEESLQWNLLVFETTDDKEYRRRAIAGMVMTLSALERREEAKHYAEMYPDAPALDKDTVICWALTGEEKNRHLQKQIMRHLDGMLRSLNDAGAADPQKQLAYLLCAEQLIQVMIPDGNYLRYYDDLMEFAVSKAKIYQSSEPDKAVNALRDAMRYAAEFDRLFMEKSTARPFTSPYLDRLEFDSAVLLVYGPLEENKRTDECRRLISGPLFASLRSREDFQALLE